MSLKPKINFKVSCVIPAYNEAKNISKVLKVVCTCELLNEIIVVDDGSKDKTKDIVKEFQKKYKQLRLIVNEKNLGKTGAIIKGINNTKNEIIFMCDADLLDFTHNNINSLVLPVITKKYDLTISNRAGDMATIMGYTNWSRFFSGERVFYKTEFQKIKLPKDGGYLLEVIMNLHYLHKNKKVLSVYMPNLFTVFQFNKMSFFTGVKNYMKMYSRIYNAMKIIEFLGFIREFTNDRFSWLYKIYFRSKNFKWFYGFLIYIFNFFDGFYLFFKVNILKFINWIWD